MIYTKGYFLVKEDYAIEACMHAQDFLEEYGFTSNPTANNDKVFWVGFAGNYADRNYLGLYLKTIDLEIQRIWLEELIPHLTLKYDGE